MSGSAGITGHVPRLLVKEAPTFLEELKSVIKGYKKRTNPPLAPDGWAALDTRAADLLDKFERMGVRDV